MKQASVENWCICVYNPSSLQLVCVCLNVCVCLHVFVCVSFLKEIEAPSELTSDRNAGDRILSTGKASMLVLPLSCICDAHLNTKYDVIYWPKHTHSR